MDAVQRAAAAMAECEADMSRSMSEMFQITSELKGALADFASQAAMQDAVLAALARTASPEDLATAHQVTARAPGEAAPPPERS